MTPGAPAAEPAEAEILWDEWGVPHIRAADAEGLAFGYGWAQAHSHGDAVLRLYGKARGRASEYWGEEFVESDRLMRVLGIAGGGEALLAGQSAEFRRWLEAFAEGVNEYVHAYPDRIAEEARRVLPVEPSDPLRHLQRLMFTFAGVTGNRPPPVELDGMPIRPVAASNTWAIGRARSASGNGLLLQNPHLPWNEPLMRFYEAQLVSPGLRVYGATLIGVPVVAIGFNERLGWSHTVNTVDVLDTYRLVLRDGGYRFDGAVRRFETEHDTLRVRQPDGTYRDEPLVLRRSVHGPVIAMEGDTAAIAVRTLAIDDRRVAEQWLEMARAASLEEFEGALRRMELPLFTVSYADRDGRILYLFAGRVPVRPRGDFDVWQTAVRGDTSATLWTEIHDYDALPRVVDPPTGFLQNSNSPPWYATLPSPLDPAAFPPYLAPDYLLAREQRALEMLLAEEPITLERLVELRHSTRMLLADRVLDDLVSAARAAGTPLAVEAADILARWDRRALPDSRGAVLFLLWASQQCRGGTPVNPCGFAVPWRREEPLTTPRGLAGPDRAAAVLEVAARALMEQAGALDVPWGAVMRLGAGLPGRGAPGDPLGVFQVVAYVPSGTASYVPVAGDTWVAALEFTPDGPRGHVLMAYGNASQAGSPHDGDQLVLLSRGEMRPLRFELADVEAAVVERVVLRR